MKQGSMCFLAYKFTTMCILSYIMYLVHIPNMVDYYISM